MANLRIDSSLFRHAWLAMLLGTVVYGGSMLCGQGTIAPAVEENVVEVRIDGKLSMPQAEVMRHIHTRAGRAYDLEIIEEDVRRLNRTGLFVNVQTLTQQVPGGRIVVFRLIERPVLKEVLFVGNQKIKTKVLQKEIGLKAGDASDPFAVEEGRRRIEEFYHTRGFSKARVTVSEGTTPGDRRAVFLINEGRKQRVLWTSFIGNTIATDARLRTQIQSKPPIFYIFKGEIDKKQVDEDVNRLTAYYRSLGFFRARIGREIEFNAAQTWARITFVIDEGPRYRVRNVSFIGNRKFSSEELGTEITLKDGQFFNQAQMTKDVTALQEKYGGIGYIFADVQADPRFLEEPGTLDLVYDISEGDRYRVGRINVEIKGEYPHTKITTVLNRISLKPGDIVDIRKLRASERRLRHSNLFMNDPMTGAAPKIVFHPPELDEAEAEIAGRPDRRPKVRGQSVDLEPCGGWQWTPSPDSRPGDRRVDLMLPCRRIEPQTPRDDSRTTWGLSRFSRSENGTVPFPNAEVISESSPTAPRMQQAYPPGRPPVSPPPTVVRGQYTPQPGWQVPVPQPPAPWSGNPNPPSYPPAYPQTPAYAGPAPSVSQEPYARMAAVPTPLPDRTGIYSEDSPFFGGGPDEDPLRDLDLRVQAMETTTGRLMFGVGVNSDAGLVGSVVVHEQNFDWTRFPRSFEDVRNATAWRGAGQDFRLELVPGTLVQRYMINFREPYLMDTAISLGLSGFYYDRRFREWSEQRLGGSVRLGYAFTHDLSGSLSFRGAKINVYDPIVPVGSGLTELDEVVGDNALYGFGARLAHDTRDNAFLPTEGHLFEASLEQVTGTFDYPRAEVDLRRYFLIHERPDGSGRHVLALSTRFGYTGDNTPIYDHYYAGGFSTLRGFDFRGASPRDPFFNVTIGGHFIMLAKIQYLFPITADDMLRAVVFCDTGTVEPTIDDWSDKYRIAPGFGLRITVPAMGPAPIALDFAFPMSTEPGDREEVFSFFVGFNY